MTEFGRHRRILVLACKGAAAFTLMVLVFTGTFLVGTVLLLLDRYAWPFVPEGGLLGLAPNHLVLAGAAAAMALLFVWKLVREPARLDRLLDVRTEAFPGDPGPDGEPLGPDSAEDIRRALEPLRDEVRRWRSAGKIPPGCEVLWSAVLRWNAVVYGTRAGRVRIVLAADLLLDRGPGASTLSPGDRKGVLAHELGHAAAGDLELTAATGGIMGLLTFGYFPLLAVDGLVSWVAALASRVPLVGWAVELVLVLGIRGPLLMVLLPYRLCQASDRCLGHIREYAADAFAARLLGTVDALISALVALARLQGEEGADVRGAGRGGILGAVYREGRRLLAPARWDRYATLVRLGAEEQPGNALAAISVFFRNLEGTHPPVGARLARLAKQGFALERDRLEGRR